MKTFIGISALLIAVIARGAPVLEITFNDVPFTTSSFWKTPEGNWTNVQLTVKSMRWVTNAEPRIQMLPIYDLKPYRVPMITNDPPAWLLPRMSEIRLQWPVNPDCIAYRVEYKSAKATTNRWIRADGGLVTTNGDSNGIVHHSIFVDASTPFETRVIGLSRSGSESAPTNPIEIPSVATPRPMGQLRHMWTDEIKSPDHRARMQPSPIYPPTPSP
jgi:hypothetical protein